MNYVIKKRNLLLLETRNGRTPFLEWIESLNDKSLEKSIDARLTRIENGNFGDHKSIGNGVYELRIPKGPGLRVYYGLEGDTIVVLIGGGNKSSQSSDIKKAHELWREYINAS
jgi:putative addiction module killer protein